MEDVGQGQRPFVLRLLDGVAAGAREAAVAPMLSLSTREAVAVVDAVAAAQRALDAAHLAAVRSLRGRDLAEVGATSVAQLVAARLRAPHGRGRADVAAAAATDPDTGTLPRMGEALVAGEVSRAHVDVAVAVLDKVPNRVRREASATLEEFLVTTSTTYRPKEVANLAREVLDRLDPDRHEQGFDPEAHTRRGFSLTTDAYGMGLPSGQLDPMTTALLKTALDHYSAPTPAQSDADGRIQWRDERTPAQRRCDALAEIARRALAATGTGGQGGTRQGEPPRIVVHATPDQVTGQVAGTVDCEATGPVPAAFLRRLVCDCVLERVLLAPNGAVLNLGRTVRTATPAQRRALAARDHGCVWPGCTIPARWTEVHHVPGWIHGSATDVGELALLCGAHHAQVDAGHYTITMLDGIPHVIQPPWLDPGQTPTRNAHWQDKRAAAALGDQLALKLAVAPPDTG